MGFLLHLFWETAFGCKWHRYFTGQMSPSQQYWSTVTLLSTESWVLMAEYSQRYRIHRDRVPTHLENLENSWNFVNLENSGPNVFIFGCELWPKAPGKFWNWTGKLLEFFSSKRVGTLWESFGGSWKYEASGWFFGMQKSLCRLSLAVLSKDVSQPAVTPQKKAIYITLHYIEII